MIESDKVLCGVREGRITFIVTTRPKPPTLLLSTLKSHCKGDQYTKKFTPSDLRGNTSETMSPCLFIEITKSVDHSSLFHILRSNFLMVIVIALIIIASLVCMIRWGLLEKDEELPRKFFYEQKQVILFH